MNPDSPLLNCWDVSILYISPLKCTKMKDHTRASSPADARWHSFGQDQCSCSTEQGFQMFRAAGKAWIWAGTGRSKLQMQHCPGGGHLLRTGFRLTLNCWRCDSRTVRNFENADSRVHLRQIRALGCKSWVVW
jgi:hypothetical protein